MGKRLAQREPPRVTLKEFINSAFDRQATKIQAEAEGQAETTKEVGPIIEFYQPTSVVSRINSAHFSLRPFLKAS